MLFKLINCLNVPVDMFLSLTAVLRHTEATRDRELLPYALCVLVKNGIIAIFNDTILDYIMQNFALHQVLLLFYKKNYNIIIITIF